MSKRTRSGSPGWKLRRLAPRALGVLGRHKASDAVLAVFEPTLVPAAERYVALYEEERLLTTSQRGFANKIAPIIATSRSIEAISNGIR